MLYNYEFVVLFNILSWNEKTNNVVDNDDEVVMKHPSVDIIHKSKVKDGQMIYLLLLEEGDNYHYTAVMNLNKLLNRDPKDKSTRIQSTWCPNCLNGFKNEIALEKHVINCEKIQTGTTLYDMPKEKDLLFKDYSKTVTPPFVIYADFESVLPPDETYHQKHMPISAGLLLVNNFANDTVKYEKFVGDQCILQF